MNSKQEIVSLIHNEFGKKEFLVSKTYYNLIEIEPNLLGIHYFLSNYGVPELEEAKLTDKPLNYS